MTGQEQVHVRGDLRYRNMPSRTQRTKTIRQAASQDRWVQVMCLKEMVADVQGAWRGI